MTTFDIFYIDLKTIVNSFFFKSAGWYRNEKYQGTKHFQKTIKIITNANLKF